MNIGEAKGIHSNGSNASMDGACSRTDQINDSDVQSDPTDIVHDNSVETIVASREDVVNEVKDIDVIKLEVGKNVGVQDTSLSEGFQSAEDFLIGRFNQIFKSNETVVFIP